MLLVETLAEVEENAIRFAQVKSNPNCLAHQRLGQFFHWYYISNLDIIAPSKFIGYKNTTIDNYKGEGKGTDTQKPLARWFEKLAPTHPSYNFLRDKLASFLSSCGKRMSKKVTQSKSTDGGIYVRIGEAVGDVPHLSDLEADEEYTPDGVDRRKSIVGSIKLRRGQRQFRDELLQRYHRRCVATECEIVALLEAAHISPYLGDKDDVPSNGLLLRADIHTLFDLNLFGIEPKTLRIELNPAIAGDPTYKRLAGKTLTCEQAARPSQTALVERYKLFTDRKRNRSEKEAVKAQR